MSKWGGSPAEAGVEMEGSAVHGKGLVATKTRW